MSILTCFSKKARRLFSTWLMSLLIWQNPSSWGQEEETVLPPSLKIVVVEGERAVNNVRKRTAVEPVVMVSDEKSRPLTGVMVMFTFPESGPSGVLPDGSKRAIVFTTPDGRAAAKGLKPNSLYGDFEILVDASFHGLTARTVIHQTNTAAADEAVKGFSPKWLAILAIAGGAAAAGVLAAGGGGGPAPPPPASTSISITPGTPSFGPPE